MICVLLALAAACARPIDVAKPVNEPTAFVGQPGKRALLLPELAPFQYQLPVRPGVAIGDGSMVLLNTTDEPVQLFAATSIAFPRTTAELGSLRVLTLNSDDVSDTGPGIQRTNLQSQLPGLEGFVVSPHGRVALYRLVRLDAGMVHLTGFNVLFAIGGRRYSEVLPQDILLCASNIVGQTTCPRAPTS